MSFVDVIAKKRDGSALSRAEIDRFIAGVTTDALPDYQIAALLMATVVRGMSDQETFWLTDAMVRSGERLDLSDVPGITVGKHSTGGVGDKVSIVLAPVAAACGIVVPKISGRGLGHTGGTLDKLESIPGYRVDLTIDEFKRVLRGVGASIIGQSGALAPSDKKLYALRDVTGTVPSIPLIAASVMSKKIAEGVSTLVLDVKCGSGAFMKSADDARELARLLVAIGSSAGVRTQAIVTDMDAPLGRAVGNALEIIESIELLKGRGPDDLTALVVTLASRMLTLPDAFAEAGAEAAVRGALASGAALEKLRAMIEWQGGDPRVLDDYGRLPGAARRHAVVAERDGYVARLRADVVGRASMALGAGRERVEDRIDRGAGILIVKRPGDAVRAGETILELLYNDEQRLAGALTLAGDAVRLSDTPPPPTPLVIDTVSGAA